MTRPATIPAARIKLTGRNNTDPRPQSTWQSDRAASPLIQPMDAPCSRGEHPLVSLAWWVVIIAVVAVVYWVLP